MNRIRPRVVPAPVAPLRATVAGVANRSPLRVAVWVLVVLALAVPASAQVEQIAPSGPRVAASATFGEAAPGHAAASSTAERVEDTPTEHVRDGVLVGDGTGSGRPSQAWPALQVSFVALQALDTGSTLWGLSRGHREVNPLLRAASDQPVSIVALKAGTTVATLWLLRGVSRRNRTPAILTLVAINAAYAFVVAHNFKVVAGR